MGIADADSSMKGRLAGKVVSSSSDRNAAHLKFLYWLCGRPAIFALVSLPLVLAVMFAAAWQQGRSMDKEREIAMVRDVGALTATLEGGTINSRAMGGAILFGLQNDEARRLVQGRPAAGDLRIVESNLDEMRRQYITGGIYLANSKGIIVANSREHFLFAAGQDIASFPCVRLALAGTPCVYPYSAGEAGRRGIYLAAPVRSGSSVDAQPVGVILINIGADKLDLLLGSLEHGIAMLVSPKGVVYSSNRADWMFRVLEGADASQDAPHLVGRQSGHVQDSRASLPFRLDGRNASIDGMDYFVSVSPMEWRDPQGEWKLVMLREHEAWWLKPMAVGVAGLAGLAVALALFWFYAMGRSVIWMDSLNDRLRRSEELLRETQSIAGVGHYIVDIPTGNWQSSEMLDLLFGIDETYAHTAMGWSSLLHPDDRAMMRNHIGDEVINQRQAFDKEFRIIRPGDQTVRWMHGLGRLILDAEGKPMQLHGTVQDITVRKLMELELVEHEYELRTLIENTPDTIARYAPDCRRIFVNPAFASRAAGGAAALLGKTPTEIPGGPGARLYEEKIREALASGRDTEFELKWPVGDGSEMCSLIRLTPERDASGKVVSVLGVGRDITELNNYRNRLELAERNLNGLLEFNRSILEKSPMGIAVYKESGRCIMANEAYARAIGATEKEVLAQDFRNNESWRRNGLRDIAIRALETGVAIKEDVEGITSFGKAVALECVFSLLAISGERHLLMLVNDVSVRLQTERALLESMREAREKELAKTRFLAAAGHDMRQPLAAAILFIDALRVAEPTPAQLRIIQRLEMSMATFNGLLESLLNISRLDAGAITPESGPVRVGELFGWLEHTFQQLAVQKGLALRLHQPTVGGLAVHSDGGLLKSVLINLVSNAIKFTASGSVMVSARRRGGKLLFQVWDTGIGIAEEEVPQIFEEFYQVGNPQRDRSGGLGLGLSIVKRTLKLLGSKIHCRSRPGRGTVFSFSLPLHRVPLGEAAQEAHGRSAPVGDVSFAAGKRFAVVEDDQMVAQAMSGWLEGLGGMVRNYQSAEEALGDSGIGDVDYYIVDYMLGGKLTGIQFLSLLDQQLGRKARAVLLSGDTSSEFILKVKFLEYPVLHKPAPIAEIISSLAAQAP